MGYESYLRKRRISVSSRRHKPTEKHRLSLRWFRLSLVYLHIKSSRRFQFSFTDFSLVYCFTFAQILPRSQPMRESKTCTYMIKGMVEERYILNDFASWTLLENQNLVVWYSQNFRRDALDENILKSDKVLRKILINKITESQRK
jgi:hypothetical protein